jgi:hypothetical protein
MPKLLLSAAALFFLTNFLSAQWNTDTLVRNAICSAAGSQYSPAMCSDGRKGAIIVWDDQRVSPQRLFVQRIDSSGKIKWVTDGIELSIPANTFSPTNPIIIPDNNGGALIVYEVSVPYSGDNIFMQHINGQGTELWNAGAGGLGVALTGDARITNHDVSNNQSVAPDGNGGAFITWENDASPVNIFAQHVDKNANLIWGAGGVQVTNSDSIQMGSNSFVVNSGKNTATIAYSYGTRFYLRRIQSDGTLAWDSAALLTSTFAGFAQAYLAFDNASTKKNVFATWQDSRNSGTTGIDLYMQRIDTSGNKLLAATGVLLAGDAGDETYPYVLVDANGATYTTYITGYQAKLQHTQSNGTNLWNGTSGVAITNNGGGNTYPVIVDNGTGGVISAWHDGRNSAESVYAQNYDADGNPLWRVNGVPVIFGLVDQNHSANPMVSFNGDTAIVAFTKANGATSDDIYAARFGGATGILPLKLLSFTAALNNDKVMINWSTANELNIARFEVQRSADAVNYSSVSSVNSKGGTGINNYAVTDASPFTGVNYYRLKEVDVDGYINYSQIVSVVKTADMSLMLYPNPAHDKVYLNITSTKQHSDVFGVYSSAGNLLQQKTIQINNGTTIATFDISGLAKGVYFIRNSNSSEKLRFVKN